MSHKSTIKSESRRLDAQRKRSEHRETQRRNLLRHVNLWTLAIWTGFYGVCLLVMFVGRESLPWRLNQRVAQDISARVDFDVVDRLSYEQEQQRRRAAAPDVFVADAEPLSEVATRLRELISFARASGGQVDKLKTDAAAKGWTLSDEAAAKLQDFAASDKQLEAYEALCKQLTDRLDDQYIVERPENRVRREEPRTTLLRRGEEPEREVPTSQLVPVSEAARIGELAARLVEAPEFPVELRGPLSQAITRGLTSASADGKEQIIRPLWRYDGEATRELMTRAAQRVDPESFKIRYQKGDTLVRAGTELTKDLMLRLQPEHEAYLRALKTDPQLGREQLLSRLGTGLVVLMITAGLVCYAYTYQRRVVDKHGRSLALACMMLAMVALTRVVERFQYPFDLPVQGCVAFIVFSAALLTISYDRRFAFGISGILAILITLAARADLGLLLTLMAAQSVTVFALREIRTRSKIVAVGCWAGLAAFAASLSTGLMAGDDFVRYVLMNALIAGSSALMAGFIVQGILPNFERLFGVATSMTLLEWCDASRPLLRRLAQEAPGTYSHSLILSQMAEEAAEAIGARGLLARVGALYHDIGKLEKAEYFVENQEARVNRHERLSPTMSLLIIIGHVKDGVEMARAYGLPRILHQFIAEHHGTTVVRYFHHAASEAAARNRGRHDREVPESEFRYPGPKPRSRETAILMLCDGCEGAVRAVAEPSAGRIESTVHHVVMDRLNDGQFDDCDITLRELKQIEASLVKSLCAIHHGRIKYPRVVSRRSDATGESGHGHEDGSTESQNAGRTRAAEVARS